MLAAPARKESGSARGNDPEQRVQVRARPQRWRTSRTGLPSAYRAPRLAGGVAQNGYPQVDEPSDSEHRQYKIRMPTANPAEGDGRLHEVAQYSHRGGGKLSLRPNDAARSCVSRSATAICILHDPAPDRFTALGTTASTATDLISTAASLPMDAYGLFCGSPKSIFSDRGRFRDCGGIDLVSARCIGPPFRTALGLAHCAGRRRRRAGFPSRLARPESSEGPASSDARIRIPCSGRSRTIQAVLNGKGVPLVARAMSGAPWGKHSCFDLLPDPRSTFPTLARWAVTRSPYSDVLLRSARFRDPIRKVPGARSSVSGHRSGWSKGSRSWVSDAN